MNVDEFIGTLTNRCCPECGRVLSAHSLYDLRRCVALRDTKYERDRLIEKLSKASSASAIPTEER